MEFQIKQIANGWLLTHNDQTWHYPSLELCIKQVQAHTVPGRTVRPEETFRRGNAQIDLEEHLREMHRGELGT
jgi:hypothetical protein